MADEQTAIPIEEPFPGDAPEPEPVEAADDEAEPEGVVTVGDKRLVDVSIIASERKRTRELAEKRVRDTELAPLQKKAAEVDDLKAAIAELRPYAEFLKQNPHLLQQRPQEQPRDEDTISDDEAAAEARDLELFDATTGKPDIARAKRIIAKRRAETSQAATQAAQQAVTPFQQRTAQQAQRENFIQAIAAVEGDEIVTPEIVARQFAELGPDLTQHPEVAQVALERAIGRAYLERRKSGRPISSRPPVFSEQPGGRAPAAVSLSEAGKKMGLTEADVKAATKTFTPGGVSEIGSW